MGQYLTFVSPAVTILEQVREGKKKQNLWSRPKSLVLSGALAKQNRVIQFLLSPEMYSSGTA